MRVLITGASGQLGKEWVEYCKSNNVDYEACDSTSLDITDFTQVQNVVLELNPTVIINCAAYTKVDQAEEEEEKAEAINGKAVSNLAKVCAEQNIKLVHYSTDYVFAGTSEDQASYPAGYDEEAQTHPENAYGRTKLHGEEAILESTTGFLILRVSWLCGAYGSNFVKTMIRLGNERSELSVVNDQFGCPTFTLDVVEQSFELIKAEKSGVFNLGSEGIITWYDFAKEIFKKKGIDVQVNPVSSIEFPTKAQRPSFSKLSTKKISTIPIIKIISWKESLGKLISEMD